MSQPMKLYLVSEVNTQKILFVILVFANDAIGLDRVGTF